MTPKEKAEELFEKYYRLFNNFPNYQYVIENLNTIQDEKLYITKQCALIAVNEIIESSPLDPNDAEEWLQPADWFSEANISADRYWIKVKKEIEAL